MRGQNLPPLPAGFEYRLDLRHYVTPRLLKDQPVHRWFWFPHSFSPQLVDKILECFPALHGGRILDPFMGAGTTLLRARQLGYRSAGCDLSPLSLFVSRVKLADYDRALLEEAFAHVRDYRPMPIVGELPAHLRRAFTRCEMEHFQGLLSRIAALPPRERDFFRLALLRVMRRVSRAQSDGGWFRWVEKPDQSAKVSEFFDEEARSMLGDVADYPGPAPTIWQDDARILEKAQGPYDLVITSPPYPNRHDYSRVFHIELLALGATEEEILRLRKYSLRSHVEALAPALETEGYVPPPALDRVLDQLPSEIDRRVKPMLAGYFEDMYLVFRALRRHLRLGALMAFVVGNVRHGGVMVPVDETLAEIGEQAGYTFAGAWVTRLRGNSAQQMGRFGREPARESVIFLRAR